MGPISQQSPVDMNGGYGTLYSLGTEKERIDYISEIIILRMRRIEAATGYIGWKLGWLFDPFGRKKAEAAKIEQQKAHITLMSFLVQNRHSYEPEFWSSIVKWQIVRYQDQCTKLLQDYKTASRNSTWDKNRALLIDALEKAVQRVYALKEPTEPTFADVFVIRNIYDDPDLKAVVPKCFTSGERPELEKVMREALLQQPEFPPPCWALTKDLPYVGKLGAVPALGAEGS